MSEASIRAILLVEDDPADIYLIQKAVAECGATIHLLVIPNGRDALAFLRAEEVYPLEPSPALILLDLNLPKLDGHAVLAELRRLPAYQATPVVIFSGAPQETEEPRCAQLGATAYVQKPFTYYAYVDMLHALVRQWLRPDTPHERSH